MTVTLSAREIAVAIGEYLVRHRCWPGSGDGAIVHFHVEFGDPVKVSAECESQANDVHDIADDVLRSTGGMH